MDVASTAMTSLQPQQWKEAMQSGKLSREQKVNELAKQFEGILLRQYLSEAMKPLDEEGGLMGANAHPIYEQMLTDTLASSITQQGSLGFSTALQAQLASAPEFSNETPERDTK